MTPGAVVLDRLLGRPDSPRLDLDLADPCVLEIPCGHVHQEEVNARVGWFGDDIDPLPRLWEVIGDVSAQEATATGVCNGHVGALPVGTPLRLDASTLWIVPTSYIHHVGRAYDAGHRFFVLGGPFVGRCFRLYEVDDGRGARPDGIRPLEVSRRPTDAPTD